MKAIRKPTVEKIEVQTVKAGRLLQVLKRLWKYLYGYKWYIVLALFLTVAGNLLGLVGPSLSGSAIDAIEPGEGAVNFRTVFFYCGLMVLFYLASSVLSYILSRVMIHLSQKISYKMRKDVFDKLMSLPVGYFDRQQTGDILSRMSYDIDTINASLSNDVIHILTSAVTVIGSLAMMIAISPMLVLIFVVTVPVTVVFTRWMSRRVRPLFRRRSAKLGELNGFVEEIISGQKTTKAYHREEKMIARFDEKNGEAADSYYAADYYGSMVGPSVNGINNLSLSFVSMFGAILYLFGKISLGNISSFVLYSRKFSGPINETANIISELQSATAAAERVFRLLDEEPEKEDLPGAPDLGEVEGSVELSHVRFGYTPDKTVLHDLSLKAEKGSLIAIVGPTGAGKTTVINLLMRFYDPDSGKITIDGKDITAVTRKSLRRSYAMVLQDAWLFGGTIYENVVYGSETATMEDVIRVCKAARIHDYIMTLPDGYETVLSEDGVNISGGQKQLLTIARAMLLDARMLILDEATSSVDTRTEIKIQDAMYRLMEGKTCFVIAHRLSTVQNADTILVVKGGDIVEMGSHRELMEKDGFYAMLYNSQFES